MSKIRDFLTEHIASARADAPDDNGGITAVETSPGHIEVSPITITVADDEIKAQEPAPPAPPAPPPDGVIHVPSARAEPVDDGITAVETSPGHVELSPITIGPDDN